MLPQIWTENFNSHIMEKLKLEAAACFRKFQLPKTKKEWESLRPELIRILKAKIHIPYTPSIPLNCNITSEIDHGTYWIRQLYFQGVKDLYVVGSLYIPKGKGPFPGVLVPHGHWKQGHLAKKIQEIGQLLAKSGYVALTTDAFGSGERCIEHGKFEYHGNQIGGSLLNVGETLAGIQIADNMRAIDLLHSLSFVRKDRTGVTGGSGGGNQTMYLAAFDERVTAAIPVVSVGTYQSYVGATNCICELIPDGLTVCEESAIIALAAPRAMLICNALYDENVTFHVEEMMRSYTEAKKVFLASGVPQNLKVLPFNAVHSYPDEARAAMLGFFDYHLKGKGIGDQRFPLPEVSALPEEKLMVFKRGKRPKNKIFSIPRYVEKRADALASSPANGTKEELAQLLKIHSAKIRNFYPLFSEGDWQKYTVEGSSGCLLPVLFQKRNSDLCRILASPGGKAELEKNSVSGKSILETAEKSGDSLLIFEPWGCGETGYAAEETIDSYCPQHKLSRALIWLGRRLMGEWTMNFMLAMELAGKLVPNSQFILTGHRDCGIAALFATVLESSQIRRVELIDSSASLRYSGSPVRSENGSSMAVCIPDILKWGDMTHACQLIPSVKVDFVRSRLWNGNLAEKT